MQPVRVTHKRQRWPSKKRLIIYFVLLVLAGLLIYNQFIKDENGDISANQTTATNTFNKFRYSTDKAASLWVVVNKGRILPSNYMPSGLDSPNIPLRSSSSSPEMKLRSDAAKALEKMTKGASDSGIKLMLASGYRSYQYQVGLYNGYLKTIGQAATDASSAKPGHSEHQTGLAADLEPTNRHCELKECFGSTPEGKWLAANAYKYGFIIRYPKNGENLTGYEYEPWHVRYVGSELAAEIQRSKKTLEQFFGLPAFSDYPSRLYQLK